MKALNLLLLVSAVALAIASVLSVEAAIALFSLMGISTIAIGDLARERKPLTLPVSVATRPSHALRLAA
jgi:hypothetical protein